MSTILAVFKAIITRLVFAAHGFLSIWQVTYLKQDPNYWYLNVPIILLFFEGIFTLIIKNNQEWKWFCPSVFLYLSSVIPSIWLLELDKIEKKSKSNLTTDNLILKNIMASKEDLDKLEKTLGVKIDIEITKETWITLIEQFLMLILIIGRWMLPKGELTKDELSQLLLIYIGTAADIIEFFDSFKEDKIKNQTILIYLTLGIWSWSLLQFTIVLTATKSRKCRLSSTANNDNFLGKIDVWGIALNMILQDIPFLIFRLLLIVYYEIVSYTNIFFTCKNTLVIALQFYRLHVVLTEGKGKTREAISSIETEEDRRRERYRESSTDEEKNIDHRKRRRNKN